VSSRGERVRLTLTVVLLLVAGAAATIGGCIRRYPAPTHPEAAPYPYSAIVTWRRIALPPMPEAAPPPTAVEPVAVDVEGVTPMAVLSGSPVAAPEAVQCVVPDEVDFADKGRAMLKDSAELEWTVDEEARLNVHQRKGRVQYDLPAGEKVLLTTPNAVEALELEGRFEVDLEASDEASINAY